MTTFDLLFVLGTVLTTIAAVPPLCFLVVYPLLLPLVASRKNPTSAPPASALPSVSFVLAARNAEQLIAEKISNCFAADYPADLIEVVLVSDGSTDATVAVAESSGEPRLKVLALTSHMGKIYALNEAVKRAQGDILIFSDADARLTESSLGKLVRHFSRTEVGGVCGHRVISKEDDRFAEAQADYIRMDTWIKCNESRIDSISSSDGKLAAIRRELFRPIPDAVTDDTYICLNVVHQHKRFLFDPDAKAYIRTPSLDKSHEFRRRRRIVAQALNGMYLMKEVLNPFRYGFFSIGVICNKIMRRLLALSFPLLLIGTLLMSFRSSIALALFGAQVAFYLVAVLEPFIPKSRALRIVSRPAAGIHYFVLGLLGTFFGITDFVLGRKAHKWETVANS